jgi:hypothetical protein
LKDDTRLSPLLELFYIDAGGGHRSAATALRDVIKERFPDWDVQLVNLLQDVLRPIDPLHRLTGTRNGEDIYNSLLRRNWTYGFVVGMRGLQKFIKLYTPDMEELLHERWQEGERPDLVVSLIPNFNGVMFRALQKAHPQTPYVTVMTDLADCPPHFWQEKQDQFLICGSELAIRQAYLAGYSQEKVFRASGMILKPHFYKPKTENDRGQERKRLRLDPGLPTSLIMFGGHGAKVAEKIIDKIEQSGLQTQSIVMCGRNDSLRKALENRKRCYPVGFTSDEVPYYMRLADFFIGKPGPGSLSEALHMGLPVIVERNNRTMPQERYNTVWIEEQKLGLVIKTFSEIVEAIQLLLTREHLEEFRQNARKLNNRAVYEIPGMLEEIMSRSCTQLHQRPGSVFLIDAQAKRVALS